MSEKKIITPEYKTITSFKFHGHRYILPRPVTLEMETVRKLSAHDLFEYLVAEALFTRASYLGLED